MNKNIKNILEINKIEKPSNIYSDMAKIFKLKHIFVLNHHVDRKGNRKC